MALSGLLLASWQIGAWYVERPVQFSGETTSVCGLYIDPTYGTTLNHVRAQVRSMMAERRIPGMAVAVSVRDRIVYREGFGYADLDRRVPACPETQFRAASVSKLFTAAAMARLFERGVLDVDAPVQRYAPTFPDKGVRVTPRLLASHRAGIRPYRDDLEAINRTHYESVTASLARFADDPLVATPGAQFVYSNYGYVLLSAVIEGAAGEDFLSYMQKDVFAPLGMTATVPDDDRLAMPSRATTYDVETPFSLDGSLVRSPDNDFSAKWASGGFLSTVEDLVRFGRAFIAAPSPDTEAGFLRPATIDLLTRPQSGLPPLAGYGLGWMSARDLHLRRVNFHFGASSGGTAVLAVYPDEGVVTAVMANLGHAKLPFRQLINVIQPFLPWPRLDTLVIFVLVGAFASVVWWTRRRARRVAA
ncbi:MAG: serine hydrolase domain-containing protein [Vicinamibacterales bacterium]